VHSDEIPPRIGGPGVIDGGVGRDATLIASRPVTATIYGAPPPESLPRPAVRPSTSPLAITAFVLSLLFFLPLLPFIGFVLGIIALATWKAPRRGRGLAIAAIPVGLLSTALGASLLLLPAVLMGYNRGKLKVARLAVTELQGAVDSYRFEHDGKCPASVAELSVAGRLKASADPWGHGYQLSGGPCRISSNGPDGVPGTADDIVADE
jgi:hypothetical protein